MLSDGQRPTPPERISWSLNAPSGAGCFLTRHLGLHGEHSLPVLMHLLVLGAFRQCTLQAQSPTFTVLMHLLVLGAFRQAKAMLWQVLAESVLMHLLVLGAFRHHPKNLAWPARGLNAPSGAGCFLTPASGNGVVAPFPGAGAPPAPQAPRGTGQQCPYLTTFRCPDAKRHRRHLRHLQPPASNDVKPKDRRS